MRLLFLGPPGAGKGTQARSLSERRGVPHIASGDLLREAIADGTPLGKKAKDYMDRGDYVPDDLMIGLLSERLREPDAANGFVLDGYPRTHPQAESLDRTLGELNLELQLVIHLMAPRDLIVQRLSGRRMCPKCQRAYHLTYDPPADDERCDDDGTALVTRPDDEPDTIRRRLEVYEEQTRSLLDHYGRRDLVVDVDGVGEVDEVAERIDKAIEAET